MFLVLIETSGNQNFIFATNKLKENIGASELTYRVGTQWLLEIVGDLNKIPELKVLKDSQWLRQNLLDKNRNPPIENSNKEIEIIIAASGKALLITQTEDIAKQIITRITTKALKEAPGIDVTGVWVKFDWDKDINESIKKVYGEFNQNQPINECIKQVYREFEKVHSRLYSPSFRFLRLPICAPCETSGLPASTVKTNPENKKIPVSAVSLAKAESANNSLNRMQKLVSNLDLKFPENTNNLEKDFDNLQWLAIIHADGNGLGQIFMNFEKYADKNDNRDYINKMRRFSLALDLCTEEAFKKALEVFKTKEKSTYKILPLVPLVLGGDDLTVVCDGKYALEFTQKFLQAFEEETKRIDLPDVDSIITEIAQKGLNSKGLSACAGIAIIKPHFPFSVGYKLAESLLKSAKKVKNKVKDDQEQNLSCSALDFQIVYDSSGIDLELIRDRLSLEEDDNEILLYKRPFVITSLENLTQATLESQAWATFYHWDKFKAKVDNISQKKTSESGEGSFLPPHQSNRIRSALLRGKQAADAEFKLIENRYTKTKELKETPESLFILIPDHEPDQPTYTTSFLDALEAVDFVS